MWELIAVEQRPPHRYLSSKLLFTLENHVRLQLTNNSFADCLFEPLDYGSPKINMVGRIGFEPMIFWLKASCFKPLS